MKLAFVGGGNMAGAIIGGVLEAGFAAADIAVLEINPDRGAELVRQNHVSVYAHAGPWLNSCDVVVMAVKPQQMQEASLSIQSYLAKPLVLSIAAGIRARAIADWLGTRRVVRAMPNMPAVIRAGISAAVAMREVSAEQKLAADTILSAVGSVIWLEDEAMLDSVTAVSGSGPAYVFYFIEAMQAAARELGFDEAQARTLTLQTFIGAAQLAATSPHPISTLREQVTSKGGTTAAALASLDRDKVSEAIRRALHAAAVRARDLGV